MTPPTDTDNPGIQQMLKEFDAAGVDIDIEQSSPAVVTAWSNVHILADLLDDLPQDQIDALDSDALVRLMENAPPVSRPEYAAFDFSKNAYPDIPALSGLRLFSRQAMVVRVEDGRDGGHEHELALVYPRDADGSADKVSILAPVGSALLGLRVGDAIDWPMPGGRSARLHVLAIRYQPEAAGELHR